MTQLGSIFAARILAEQQAEKRRLVAEARRRIRTAKRWRVALVVVTVVNVAFGVWQGKAYSFVVALICAAAIYHSTGNIKEAERNMERLP